MININTMNCLIAKYHQLPNAIEDLIQDMLVGPTEYWKGQFGPVFDELLFRMQNKLAWQVEMFLKDLPETILRSMNKSTYEYLDDDDNHIPTKDAFEYHLSWGPNGNGPYSIEIYMDRIQVDGAHSPSEYDQEAIEMVHRYGDYYADNYTYLIDHDTFEEFSDFIFSEIGRHKCFWDAV
jgi:hypothetical protein